MTRAELVAGLKLLQAVLEQKREEIAANINKYIDADKAAEKYHKEWDAIKLERESNGTRS